MSYDDTATDSLNLARGLLGDTSNDSTAELLTDDHIETMIGFYGFNGGVAFLATRLAAQQAQDPKSITLPSGLSFSGIDAANYWLGLVKTMGGIPGQYTAFATTLTRTDGYSAAASA